MNMDEMLKALEADAEEAANKIIAGAKAQSKEITKEAEKEGEKLAQRSLEQVRQKLGLEKAKTMSSANFYVRKEVLKAKEEVASQFFTQLEEKAKKEFGRNTGFFQKLADEALSKFKGQKVSILVNSNDKELAENALRNTGLEYQLKDGLKCIGGLKVQSEDGRLIVDNTLDSRLQKLRQLYEPTIIANLFGEEK